MLNRLYPTYAKGYLETVQLPEGGPWELLDLIGTSWGGGTFSLQPRERKFQGHTVFARGGCQVTIAGPAKFRGQPYSPDGRILEHNPAPAPAAPLAVPAQPSSNLDGRLWSLLEKLTQKTQAGAPAQQSLADIAEIGRVFAEFRGGSPTAAVDPADSFEREIARYHRLRKLFDGDRDRDRYEPSAPSDPMGQMMQMFMMKMMGGGDAMPHAPFGGPPPVSRPPYTPPPPPPVSAPTPNPQPPAPTPAPPADDDDDGYEDEPMTAAEVAEGMAGLDAPARAQMLAELLEQQPEEVRAALFERLGGPQLEQMFAAAGAGMPGIVLPKAAAG